MAYRKNSLLLNILKEMAKTPTGKEAFSLLVETVGQENLPKLLRISSNILNVHPSEFLDIYQNLN